MEQDRLRTAAKPLYGAPICSLLCQLVNFWSILLIAAGIMVSRADPERLATYDKEPLPPGAYIAFGIFGLLTSVFPPFLPDRPWKWVYGLILIIMGMPSCCYLPVTIPLLIFWVQPETREYFRQSHIRPTKHE
jgi:hypothetical protein